MILLDMDGVLCDFVGATCVLFQKNPSYVYANWKPGNWNVANEIGVTEDDVWKKVSEVGEPFWENIDPYPWAKEMYEWLTTKGEVVILTSPAIDPTCHSGTVKWLYKFTGNEKFRNYLIGPKKEACARPSNLLIDDSDKNVEAFLKPPAGCPEAKTLLFPQPWNKMFEFKGDKFTNLRYQMQNMGMS